MSLFRPCLGKTACVDGEDGCRTCGRSYDEIQRTRDLIDQLTAFALEMDYENGDEFADYVARRLRKKLEHARQEQTPEAAHG